jgi:threonine efflux protein
MIDLAALASVALIYAAGVMSPGPNFMVVAQVAAARGIGPGLAAVAGVVLVNGIWAAASLFGLTAVFAAFPALFLALKIAGAAYLIWMGVRLWRDASKPLADVVRADAGLAGAFRAGLATNLSNAKAVAFFASAFAAAAPSPDKVATLWLALGLVLVMATAWYGLVALALSRPAVAGAYGRMKRWIDRACGAILMGFGVRLALER